MDTKAHYFFAIRLPENVKIEMKRICLKLEAIFPFQRWVHQEDYHITLAFLGAALETKLAEVKRMAAQRVEGQKAFSIHIHQLGVFGKEDAPRIFWADMQKEESLMNIQELVFSACTQAGFELEKRPFKPHITLARKWAANDPFQKKQLIEENPFKHSPTTFQAKEIVLYQTHLDRTPKYEKIAIFTLQDE
ncbi:2'-5' RNA ligase [Cytobacillus eiseniae]|uniref:RNA 2',3'-cyclic phosphodiesterase n=1 Tax=Cytobacillus eiseniae TaxID=762947 RepID=A0ABS4RFD9_9BACI|nr:RNA 2',3'-cyclic phosphodiesterase [Cytobacillus eiseniae]MBP2241463.1 2'-5' RNA ligase [Cytobacillus eiseniae]